VGKANGPRERAPDGVPTIGDTWCAQSKDGGHGARAPLPTLRLLNTRSSSSQGCSPDHRSKARITKNPVIATAQNKSPIRLAMLCLTRMVPFGNRLNNGSPTSQTALCDARVQREFVRRK
jgi:hypothetical protein